MFEPASAIDQSETFDTDERMLRVLMAAAAYQARRVARTLKLSDYEREDAEQEILLVLLERRRYFDPARGPWTPFAHRIARQAAQTVADDLVAARKLFVSLDQPLTLDGHDGEAIAIAETIADSAVLNESEFLDAISLLSFVRMLPQELRLVAEGALKADGDLADAQRTLGLSTSEFYRRLREIRYRLFAIGLVDRKRVQEP